uniref:Cadherin domain-containing protein n=1 Tax=Romanomermis culicivorax TaxID=13658 RepID=A0A915KN20_ROMCU
MYLIVNIRFVKSMGSIIRFTQLFYDFSIAENSPSGSMIGRLEPESSSFKKSLTTIKFYISEQSENVLPFILNPENGVLSLEKLIDREQKSEYTFSAMITDGRSASYAIVSVRVERNLEPEVIHYQLASTVPHILQAAKKNRVSLTFIHRKTARPCFAMGITISCIVDARVNQKKATGTDFHSFQMGKAFLTQFPDVDR